MLLVAFHDVHTGLAMRPSWGPMYGKQAIGEQALAREALQRLPADAIVLADCDFGIFAFAHAVQQTQRPLVFRLTRACAKGAGRRSVPGKTPQGEVGSQSMGSLGASRSAGGGICGGLG